MPSSNRFATDRSHVTTSLAPFTRLDGVSLRYHRAGRDVLSNISFDIVPGSFYYLLGENGAGKTSLLNVLSLTMRPTGGRMFVMGRDVTRAGAEDIAPLRRRIGMIYQDFRLLEHKNAFENVALPLRIARASESQVNSFVAEMLGWLGMADFARAMPGDLSLGQRQLLAVARAVVTRPGLLLADEPTSNVDARRLSRLMHLFEQLHRLGTAVIFATHNDALIERYPHAVLHLRHGKLHAALPADAAAASS